MNINSLVPSSVHYPNFNVPSPVILTREQIFLGLWVAETFQLDGKIPHNIASNFQDYIVVKEYLESKGNYSPNKLFLDHVYRMVENNEFGDLRDKNINIKRELQGIETTMFYRTGGPTLFANKLTAQAKQTSCRVREGKQLGVRIAIDSSDSGSDEGKVPSLQRLCYNTLMKNGYPHDFVDPTNL